MLFLFPAFVICASITLCPWALWEISCVSSVSILHCATLSKWLNITLRCKFNFTHLGVYQPTIIALQLHSLILQWCCTCNILCSLIFYYIRPSTLHSSVISFFFLLPSLHIFSSSIVHSFSHSFSSFVSFLFLLLLLLPFNHSFILSFLSSYFYTFVFLSILTPLLLPNVFIYILLYLFRHSVSSFLSPYSSAPLLSF